MKFSTTILVFIAVMLLSCNSLADNQENSFSMLIQKNGHDLKTSANLSPLVAAAGGKKVVLLGEASHGTSEFYAWRDSISRRLIVEKDFRFIVVEGDWASIFQLNRYVKGFSEHSSAVEVVRQFNRWPLWMWRNEEVVALAEWMKAYNSTLPADRKVGFYGMDVYDEWNSYDELLTFTRTYDSTLYASIAELYRCMSHFEGDSWQYAGAVARGYSSCAHFLQQAYNLVEETLAADDSLSSYDALFHLQNARVFKNAEKFFRKAVSDRGASWNSRVFHMFATLNTLLDFYGPDAKAIVWAHNTHIGDARYTDMVHQGQVNSGQLCRENFGEENVLLVGFGSFSGRVTAGRQWGAAMLELRLPNARSGSLEYHLHQARSGNFLMMFDEKLRSHPFLGEPIGHRAVGVVYNPEQEHLGNYVPSIPALRYDAFLFFENTRPLRFVE
jgi:erythromycin esterase